MATALKTRVANNTNSKNTTDEQQMHWSFWLGLSFFCFVIVGLVSMAWFVGKKVSAEESAPVTSLVISGEMPYTSKQDILTAIDTVNLGNFFKVNVNHVQEKVAQLPWVYSVAVRKQWPNELKIYVVDQSPVAVWNGEFFINEFGKAFQADPARVSEQLPMFFGPEGSEILALDNFKNLNKLLTFKELSIDELVLTERFSWQLTLNDGVQLNLGREERVKRVQRFMDIYPQIKQHAEQGKAVNYVDLRYDTGVAVGWKSVAEKQRV